MTYACGAENRSLSWEEALSEWRSGGNDKRWAFALTLPWQIWSRHNRKVFEGKTIPIQNIIGSTSATVLSWFKVKKAIVKGNGEERSPPAR